MSGQLKIGTIKILTVVVLVLGLITIFLLFNGHRAPVDPSTSPIKITAKWELPNVLREISAISWVSQDMIAAVQDEKGVIFMYDLANNKLANSYKFGDDGDYEGLVVLGENAFVLRSDGDLFEVWGYKNPQPQVEVYKTPFKSKHNMETLTFDKERNSLLMVPKDRNLEDDTFKGIYAFSLDTYELNTEAVMKISLDDEMLTPFVRKHQNKTFRPSDMAIHPKTGDLYILEGTRPKLMIMSSNNEIKGVYPLDPQLFPQPEGITFSEDGGLYVASEAGRGSEGVIYKLVLTEL